VDMAISEAGRLLGTLLNRGEASVWRAHDIRARDFVEDKHQRLTDLAWRRFEAGLPVDTVGLSMAVHGSGEAESYGGTAYVSGLADGAVTETELEGLVRSVRVSRDRYALQLKLARVSNQLSRRELSPVELAGDLVPALSMLTDYTEPSLVDDLEDLEEEVASEAYGETSGYMPTGIPEWDSDPDFFGLSRRGVTLFLAASGMGKTTLLNRLCLGLLSEGRRVHLVGTETSRKRRLRDIAYSLAGVDKRRWSVLAREASVSPSVKVEAELSRYHREIGRALSWLKKQPLTVTGSGATVEQIAATSRRLLDGDGLDVVIVDYLQDIAPTESDTAQSDKVWQTGHSSRSLKELSAELDLPVLVGAQVSGEKAGPKSDPRPALWDCQWSSTAHQDAQIVYSLYRDDYYRDRAAGAWLPKGRDGVVEVITRKQRVGRLSTLELDFDGPSLWIGSRMDRYDHEET